MIKRGRIVVIGDEVFEAIALAAGVDAYVFDGNCEKLANWLQLNSKIYDIIIYLDIIDKCTSAKKLLEELAQEKITLRVESPPAIIPISPREYYRELARKILGIEVTL